MLQLLQPWFYMKRSDKESLFKILYQDNHILVALKSSDLLTQAAEKNESNLQDLLKEELKIELSKDRVFLHAIYRLDKQVSGIVLFAKSSKALSRLNQEMREKKIIKKYQAIVEGILDKKKAELKNQIEHLSHRAKIVDPKKAKTAILEYEVIKEEKDKSYLLINLITGRYHQIRAQLSFIGHPIVGDEKYGSKQKSKSIKLHCSYLEFDHPVTKKKVILENNFLF